MSEKLKRFTNKQMKALLSAMETNPELLAGGYIGPHGRVNTFKKWEEISVGLNNLGTSKSARQWAKTWTDWRYHTRQKAAKIKRVKSGEEGSILTVTPLSSVEEKLLNMVGIGNGQAFIPEDYELPNADMNVGFETYEELDNLVKAESPISSTESLSNAGTSHVKSKESQKTDNDSMPIEMRLLKLEEEKLAIKTKKMKLIEMKISHEERGLNLKKIELSLIERQTTALCAIAKAFKMILKDKKSERFIEDSD